MPPTYAQIPIVPLTDTEVIVYFFQSLSRPIVSLRLYARSWGPASIVNVPERIIAKSILSISATPAQSSALRRLKRARTKFGEEWEEAHRHVFDKADDVKATDLSAFH